MKNPHQYHYNVFSQVTGLGCVRLWLCMHTPFSVSVCSKTLYIYMMPFYEKNETENGKPKRLYLFCLPSADLADGGLSFVRLLTKKQTEVIRLQTD